MIWLVFLILSSTSGQATTLIHYADSSAISPENRSVNQVLKQNHILERVGASFQKIYQLDSTIQISTEQCGQVNAFYYGRGKIALCLEMVSASIERARKVLSEPKKRALLVGSSLKVVLAHELGHALIDLLHLPVTGREEDVADQISLFTVLHLNAQEMAVAGSLLVFNDEYEGTVGDTHSLDSQRRINMMCWAYGANPNRFAYLRSKIPNYRVGNCSKEFRQLNFALNSLLKNELR